MNPDLMKPQREGIPRFQGATSPLCGWISKRNIFQTVRNGRMEERHMWSMEERHMWSEHFNGEPYLHYQGLQKYTA